MDHIKQISSLLMEREKMMGEIAHINKEIFNLLEDEKVNNLECMRGRNIRDYFQD